MVMEKFAPPPHIVRNVLFDKIAENIQLNTLWRISARLFPSMILEEFVQVLEMTQLKLESIS